MNQAKKQSNKKVPMGSIRIIAGKYRGRKLPVLMSEGLRPTTDRVKETVFNWLMPYINNSRCLDCFAGAGSLGFEAISRGAEHVTLVELNKAAAKQLQQNKELLKTNNLSVVNTDLLNLLNKKDKSFYDIVFIDPPFRQDLVKQTCTLLTDGWLAEQALIYVESELEMTMHVPEQWSLLKEKVAGQVVYRLYAHNKN